MTFHLQPFAHLGLDAALLRLLIDEHEALTRPRLARLWAYYRNPCDARAPKNGASGRRHWAGRAYTLAQEAGLPGRLRADADTAMDDRRSSRREVVIENDIAWRVQAMVDFMFGKPVTILSTARDEPTRRAVERVLDAAWEASGGIALLQDTALLGHVYGHVDLLLRADGLDGVAATGASETARDESSSAATLDDAVLAAQQLRIEVIDPTRGIPILDPADYRRVLAYVLHVERELNKVEEAPRPFSWRQRWMGMGGRRDEGSRGAGDGRGAGGGRRATSTTVEILSPDHWQVYEDDRLIAHGPNDATPGELPVVHIQNIAEPFRYEGLGEVEPLIPLQDELNTRLSDRANRVTMQSFRMYLAKGLDGFDRVSIEPGAMWTTDNMEASVEAFGGDADSPSEERHIQEVREALDKASGVPPLASGVVRARIGNLTSANALRITLMGVLSKTARKRVTYGRGIVRMCGLILAALDEAGVLKTDPRDRGVRLAWRDPLPEDVSDEVAAARAKTELGVPNERVLAELGYAPTDPGIV